MSSVIVRNRTDISCREATYPSSRTSGSDRLRAIISEAMRLNWLILNISFIFSWFSLGMTTGFPPSPGPSRGLARESARKHKRHKAIRAQPCVYVFKSVRAALHTHHLSQGVLAPFYHHTCCTHWSRAGWTCPASPTPERWLKPLCSRRTSSSYGGKKR